VKPHCRAFGQVSQVKERSLQRGLPVRKADVSGANRDALQSLPDFLDWTDLTGPPSSGQPYEGGFPTQLESGFSTLLEGGFPAQLVSGFSTLYWCPVFQQS